jgi:hypothetical protein
LGGFSLDLVGDDVKIVVGEPHVVVHLSQGPPVPETGMRVSNMNTSTRTTATATRTTATGYLNHWIRLNSGQSNSAEIASLALTGKRFPQYCMVCGWRCNRHSWCELNLTMPSKFIHEIDAMTPAQLRVSKTIARSFGHLWSSFDCPVEWADHFNNGQEDGHNPSSHPLPTPADQSASGRYKWDVNRIGVVNFEVNRPQGTACRVNGTLTNFVITITKLALDRHLKCLYQQLQNVFGLTSEDAIERIETAKGFNLMGIRGGELHKVLAE